MFGLKSLFGSIGKGIKKVGGGAVGTVNKAVKKVGGGVNSAAGAMTGIKKKKKPGIFPTGAQSSMQQMAGGGKATER